MTPRACCSPARTAAAAPAPELRVPASADAARASPPRTDRRAALPRYALVELPGGSFLMGERDGVGFPEDGEGPPREVRVSPFEISPTAVTNDEFARFVRETGYLTEAERCGWSFVFYLQLPAALRSDARRVASVDLPWWVRTPDACWQRPEGPGSRIDDRLDHPVVHVSWNDAYAYCAWAGLRLPTEAQWEYAARGGLTGCLYPWGDALQPDGRVRCNIWQGDFPNRPAPGWQPGTVPAHAFEPNGFGLYGIVGNVWEWCDDWFGADYHRTTGDRDPRYETSTGRRSQRGGSFLCHDSYCNRYRVAARGSNTPGSAASNVGFRVSRRPAVDEQAPRPARLPG